MLLVCGSGIPRLPERLNGIEKRMLGPATSGSSALREPCIWTGCVIKMIKFAAIEFMWFPGTWVAYCSVWLTTR